MTSYFQQYKPFLLFLGKFFLAYLILTGLYQWYLSSFTLRVDDFTVNVSRLTEMVLRLFDNQSYVKEDFSNNQYQLFYKDRFVARIIEGCNAISVIVLFSAFVVAFSGRLKPTILFVLIGSVFIYVLNIFRIAVLTVLVYNFPEKEHFLHGVLFPLIIYGAVFLLWVFWVNNYSDYAAVKSK